MIWKQYGVLLIFSVVSIVGLAIRYLVGEQSTLWSFWSAVDVSFAVALGVLAFMAYREMIRDEDEIALFFDVEGEHVDTGLRLLRKDCTRSEIIGILGMMQKRTEGRFVYDAKHLYDLMTELNSLQRGKRTVLRIPLFHNEFE